MRKAIVVFVAVSLLGIIGYYIYANQNQNASNDKPGSLSEYVREKGLNVQGNGPKISGVFMDLLTLDENYLCSFETTDKWDNKINGLVYVTENGNMIRGELEVESPEEYSYDVYLIKDGTHNYYWTSLEDQGYKSDIQDGVRSFLGLDKNADTQIGIDGDMKVNFNCDPWNVDKSIFDLPVEIEFLDI